MFLNWTNLTSRLAMLGLLVSNTQGWAREPDLPHKISIIYTINLSQAEQALDLQEEEEGAKLSFSGENPVEHTFQNVLPDLLKGKLKHTLMGQDAKRWTTFHYELTDCSNKKKGKLLQITEIRHQPDKNPLQKITKTTCVKMGPLYVDIKFDPQTGKATYQSTQFRTRADT